MMKMCPRKNPAACRACCAVCHHKSPARPAAGVFCIIIIVVMPSREATFADLPQPLVQHVLDMLEPEERLNSRLVCLEWAGLPLRHARAGRFSTAERLLKRLAKPHRKTADTSHHARFNGLHTLEIGSDSSYIPKLLREALEAPACSDLKSLTFGNVGWNQSLLDTVADGAPRLRHLCLGSTPTGKMWIRGDQVLHRGFLELETLEAHGTRANPKALVLATSLPRLRSVHVAFGELLVRTALPPDCAIQMVHGRSRRLYRFIRATTCDCTIFSIFQRIGDDFYEPGHMPLCSHARSTVALTGPTLYRDVQCIATL